MAHSRRTLVIAALVATPLILASTVHAADSLSDPAEVRRTAERGTRTNVSPPPAPSVPASERIGREVVALVNAARSAQGLPPLAWNAAAGRAAQSHSADQAARNLMTHAGSDGSTVKDRLDRVGLVLSFWGESVAAGYVDARRVVDAWLESAGHTEILLGQFTIGAAGMATSASGTNYWTLVVAR